MDRKTGIIIAVIIVVLLVVVAVSMMGSTSAAQSQSVAVSTLPSVSPSAAPASSPPARTAHPGEILTEIPCPNYGGTTVGSYDKSKYCIVPQGDMQKVCDATAGCSGWMTTTNAGWNAAFPGAGQLGRTPAIPNGDWTSYY